MNKQYYQLNINLINRYSSYNFKRFCIQEFRQIFHILSAYEIQNSLPKKLS